MNELINYIPYLFGILIIISIVSFGVSIAQKSIAAILIGIVAVIISGTFFGGSVIIQKYTPFVMEYVDIAKDYISDFEDFTIPTEEEIINNILEDYTFKLNPDGTLTLEEK